MTGFNLPPGCSVSDIPGNRPEDEKAEALENAIYEAIGGSITSQDSMNEVVEKLAKLVDKAYSDGYAQGQSDAALDAAESLRRAGDRKKKLPYPACYLPALCGAKGYCQADPCCMD